MFQFMSLGEHTYTFLLGKYLGVKLLGHKTYFTFLRFFKLLNLLCINNSVYVCTHTHRMRERERHLDLKK